ncbi:MAG: PQQ-binding-like beta-propeller repeat protein [Bryobacteraceae bacterium]|nr:PQQ-binding-like beta-propeller repeat protein [Bryobacteraceae bacterium]
MPPGKSSPVISGDRLFLTGWRGDLRLVLCVDRRTGKLVWERAVNRRHSQTMNKLNDPAAPSPAVDGTNVYAFFPESGIVSYDRTGKERWHVSLGPFSSVHGIGASPIVASGVVVLAIEQQSGGSFLTGWDATRGSVRWKTALADVGQQGYGTPFVHAPGNGAPQIVYSRPGEIGGWSLATGEALWWIRGTGTQTYSTPAVADGVVYAAADGDTVEGAMKAWEQFLQKWNRTPERSLRVKEDWHDDTLARADRTFGNNDGMLDENEWRILVRNNRPRSLTAVRLGGKGEVTDSHVLWQTTRAIPAVSSPVAFQNLLFYIRDGGIFTSLDASTGKVLKEARLEGAIEKFFASLVAGDHKIYVASEQGKVIVIRAAADWEVLSVQDLGEEIYATPAVSDDGRIYIRTSKAMYCFERR